MDDQTPRDPETELILAPTPMSDPITPQPNCSTTTLAVIHKFSVLWYALVLIFVIGTAATNNSHTTEVVVSTGPTESPTIEHIAPVAPYIWFIIGIISALITHVTVLYRYRAYSARVLQQKSLIKGYTLAATLEATAVATLSLTKDGDVISIMALSVQIGATHAFLKFSDPSHITALRDSPLAWRLCAIMSGSIVALLTLRIAFHGQPWWLYGCVATVITLLLFVLLNQGLFIYQVSFWDSYMVTEGIHLVVCLLCNTLFAVFLICSTFDPKDPSR